MAHRVIFGQRKISVAFGANRALRTLPNLYQAHLLRKKPKDPLLRSKLQASELFGKRNDHLLEGSRPGANFNVREIKVIRAIQVGGFCLGWRPSKRTADQWCRHRQPRYAVIRPAALASPAYDDSGLWATKYGPSRRQAKLATERSQFRERRR